MEQEGNDSGLCHLMNVGRLAKRLRNGSQYESAPDTLRHQVLIVKFSGARLTTAEGTATPTKRRCCADAKLAGSLRFLAMG